MNTLNTLNSPLQVPQARQVFSPPSSHAPTTVGFCSPLPPLAYHHCHQPPLLPLLPLLPPSSPSPSPPLLPLPLPLPPHCSPSKPSPVSRSQNPHFPPAGLTAHNLLPARRPRRHKATQSHKCTVTHSSHIPARTENHHQTGNPGLEKMGNLQANPTTAPRARSSLSLSLSPSPFLPSLPSAASKASQPVS
ncbi:hypothetical protein AOQ84DRAFT_34976 [Glonium stellatum]|uniref:Uncharacterized protein n=1 Tax=Glonium stellatum TaxID=574774 RepID=A0A8E2F1C2_9PEZI|nr:hypothetical protein AOQ84DRAFT_34976 [Glonium stellatum]